ncbi:primase alpha helix C-terminal domain-containing protein [Streptococcus hongkongensis]|nr:phage protein [Streptococcus uberis]
MAIYETRGFSSLIYLSKKDLSPFDYISQIKPMKPPENMSIEDFKKYQAPYCLSGKVKQEKNGSYKRNNQSLLYRDLIFLDYDDIHCTPETFKNTIHSALSDYSYILYPTIKHSTEKPRYRLVVQPDNNLTEPDYKATVKKIADLIGLPFDCASLTWSQLMGLPVTRDDPETYDKIINKGTDFPTIRGQTMTTCAPKERFTPQSGKLSITMKVINTLLNGYGDEGGRNIGVTRFVGLLLNKYVNCDIETAYQLATIANDQTEPPLPLDELDRTFRSVLEAEMRKRGKQL